MPSLPCIMPMWTTTAKSGQIDVTEAGLEGGLEGASGNPGYSSEVQGVFNIAGALQTVDYFNEGENERLFTSTEPRTERCPTAKG